ncbi:MAG: hypothetical protein KF884_03005 [Fimbriimonadaceae bacterium]|nr:hypothetical protein [Fimbriimonadaceae bacterium]QYK59065.1 MAG: hypothetical protein KF884_03005 [Fimbriimonadaceae bacterium]
MFGFWEKELTPEEEDQLIERAASAIAKRGLEAPAILFFEMHRPLANVGGHLMVASSAFLVPFFGRDQVDDYSRLLSKPASVDRLIQRLESQAQGAT